ncbi:MAG: PilZ domain-containing protein [Candidatus Omnitrophica bacterium]|nr:PilZ domain-containing protein [Candidatus Omnitrophota bacterium]
MGIEQRKERRIRVDLPVKIVYKDNQISGNMQNISRLGAYVELEREIPPTSEIEVSFDIPGYTKNANLIGKVGCQASVFRSNLISEAGQKKSYGVGIFFSNFSDELNRDKLSAFIDFLILQEKDEIKSGLKRWREKRIISKKSRMSKKAELLKKESQAQVIGLLEKILERLDQIERLLPVKKVN